MQSSSQRSKRTPGITVPAVGLLRNPDVRNVVLLLGLAVLLWIPRLHGPIDFRYDAGVYYITGTSLAEGKGYRLLYEPGEIQTVQYPPLLPLFVACHQWILGTSDPEVVGQWLRLSYFLVFLLYVQAVYAMARQYLVATESLLIGVISCLCLQSYFLSDLLFAEIPFALLATLFVICNRRGDNGLSFVGTAFLGIAAYLLRTAGIALLGAWVAESFLKKAWRQLALRTAVALVPLVAWQAYISHVKSGLEYQHPAYPYQRLPYMYYNVSYSESTLLIDTWTPELGPATWGDLTKRVFDNLAAMQMKLGEAITAGKGFWEWLVMDIRQKTGLPLLPLWVVTIPITLLSCLTIAGTALLLARREWFLAIYIIASVVVMCLTPWANQFCRYLTPLTPFLALSVMQLLAAFRVFSRQHWGAKGRAVGQTVTVLVVATILAVDVYTVLRCYQLLRHQGRTYAEQGRQSGNCLFFYDRTWRDYDTALAWLKEQARPDAIVATVAPERVYLKAGLRAVMPPMEVDTAKAQHWLDAVPVAYIIADELKFADTTRKYVDPVMRCYPERWQLIYGLPDTNTRVYQRVPARGTAKEQTGPTPRTAQVRTHAVEARKVLHGAIWSRNLNGSPF
jgi:hypothetical protein